MPYYPPNSRKRGVHITNSQDKRSLKTKTTIILIALNTQRTNRIMNWLDHSRARSYILSLLYMAVLCLIRRFPRCISCMNEDFVNTTVLAVCRRGWGFGLFNMGERSTQRDLLEWVSGRLRLSYSFLESCWARLSAIAYNLHPDTCTLLIPGRYLRSTEQ